MTAKDRINTTTNSVWRTEMGMATWNVVQPKKKQVSPADRKIAMLVVIQLF